MQALHCGYSAGITDIQDGFFCPDPCKNFFKKAIGSGAR